MSLMTFCVMVGVAHRNSPRGPVQRVDHPRLARDARHHPPPLARLQPRVDPAHRARVRRHRRVHQDALERVIEVPVVVQVLVVPHDSARVGVERQRRVVVEMRQVGPAQHELRRRRGHRRPHVDQVQLGVEAGHHPGAHVPPLLEGHVAPGLVARLAGGRDHPRAPQLGAGARVVGRDDARLRAALGHAPAPGDDLAVRDDRARGLVGRVLAVVEDLRLPGQPARRRVEGEHVVVVARVDDQVVVDGKVPVALGEDADDELLEVVRPRAAVLPDADRR